MARTIRLKASRRALDNFWQSDKRGFADQVEILAINDATARISALQGGQVHMINMVEPKVVDLVKRVPGLKGRGRVRSRL